LVYTSRSDRCPRRAPVLQDRASIVEESANAEIRVANRVAYLACVAISFLRSVSR